MFPPRRVCDVQIGALASSPAGAGAGTRASALVDGSEVWFESTQIPLRAAPEVFGSAFLIPALAGGGRLVLEGTVCPTWHANVTRLEQILHDWWGTPTLAPEVALAAADAAPGGKTALCFSGGVDSFYSLLKATRRIDLLVTVVGFDIALDDAERIASLERSLREISAAVRIPSIVVRTNLREHPLFQRVSWERAHGGALAAIGHVLGGDVGHLMVSSSIPYRSRREWWGSHWKIDPLWSSARLELLHFGAELHRLQKVRTLAAEPLVQRHLRVCWENRSSSGNCSRCEKCLFAMLVLAECGQLEHFTVFDADASLAERLDALPRVRSLRRGFRELAASPRLPRPVTRALADLNERTQRAQSLPVRARRFLLAQVLSRSRPGPR
jgi:hypothetical protein